MELAGDEAVAHPVDEVGCQPVDAPDVGNALELAAPHEPQGDGVDKTEHAIAADRQAEELGILGTAAIDQLALGAQELERLDVGDERGRRQVAAMHVGGERAADGDAIDAALLLVECPRRLVQCLEELGPLLGAGIEPLQRVDGAGVLGEERQHLAVVLDRLVGLLEMLE